MTEPTVPTVVLGRTGLEVSVAGLGCGGHSRLGQTRGASVAESVDLVRRAIDLGVTFVDTARVYGTEEIVGQALTGRRGEVVLSSKSLVIRGDGGLLSGEELRRSVELSLRRLRCEHIDVFHLHGVQAHQYEHCREELLPELWAARERGEIGHVAISEHFDGDPGHEMLQRAIADDVWGVVMVGFNLLNPSARERVLAGSIERDVGVLGMFAVRRALSQPDELRRLVAELVARGEVDGTGLDPADPLAFLAGEDVASSVVEAAYRFVRHEPGVHVVLTGTGRVDHLEHNVAVLAGPPLPDEALERLAAVFGRVDSVSGD